MRRFAVIITIVVVTLLAARTLRYPGGIFHHRGLAFRFLKEDCSALSVTEPSDTEQLRREAILCTTREDIS